MLADWTDPSDPEPGVSVSRAGILVLDFAGMTPGHRYRVRNKGLPYYVSAVTIKGQKKIKFEARTELAEGEAAAR